MANERYRLGFHIAPKTGWLNDPNGLCQFRGVYHAFFQFNPVWPAIDTRPTSCTGRTAAPRW